MVFGLGCGIKCGSKRHTLSVSDPEFIITDWAAGTNTTLSITSGVARATRTTSLNPRITRQYSNLISGESYNVAASGFLGTASSIILRVSDADVTLVTNIATQTRTSSGTFSLNFTAPADGHVYIGLIAVVSSNGQYGEISENLLVTKN